MYVPSFPMPSQAILTAAYTALEALRIGAIKFDLALEEFDPEAVGQRRMAKSAAAIQRAEKRLQVAIKAQDADSILMCRRDLKDIHEYAHFRDESWAEAVYDLQAARSVCRFFASCLQEFATGVPSVSDTVFQAIRDHVNLDDDHIDHVEGAVLAMTLACRFLAKARDLSLDAGQELIDLLSTAEDAIRSSYSLLEGCSYCDMQDKLLDQLLAGKQPRRKGTKAASSLAVAS